jgi:hypothetical protein
MRTALERLETNGGRIFEEQEKALGGVDATGRPKINRARVNNLRAAAAKTRAAFAR